MFYDSRDVNYDNTAFSFYCLYRHFMRGQKIKTHSLSQCRKSDCRRDFILRRRIEKKILFYSRLILLPTAHVRISLYAIVVSYPTLS